MFSEMRGSGEQLQRITSPCDLQNGLQSQTDDGQHLRARGNIHTYFCTEDHETSSCGLKQSNSPCNGCNHINKQHVANLQLNVAGQSCQTELTSTQKQPPGNRLQHNRVSVNSSLRECSVVIHQHQTGPHLSLRKCAVDPPAQFKGHRNCGLPVCVAEQQSVSVKESLLKELNAPDVANMKEDGFDAHNSSFNSMFCTRTEQRTLSRYLGHVMKDLNRASLVQKMMLPTKDANTTSQQTNRQAKLDLNGPGGAGLNSKRSQRVIQDQIQNVVVHLEEVLQGLKEIHLEMKEVVQQIDLLTADIDVCEKSGLQELLREASPPPFKSSISEAGKETVCSNKLHPSRTDPPPVPPPAPEVTSQRQDSGTATGRRGRKPPPYPCTSAAGTAPVKKAPPYSFKRRLRSTIV